MTAVLLPLLACADAQAGTLSVVQTGDGPVVRYVDGGAELNDVEVLDYGPGGVLLTDAPDLAVAGDGCEWVQILGRSAARCTVASVRLELDLGDGADVARVSRADGTVVFLGGAGDDRFNAFSGETRPRAEAHGGPGDDVLWGGGGPDALHGGAGNDLLFGGFELDDPDTFDGGEGTDTVTYSPRGFPMRADLDGDADDGVPGEGDRIGADVESLIGTQQDDVLIGNDAANTLDGGAGADVLDPRGGEDVVRAGPPPMPKGPTADDDTITVRDGAADRVTCGLGADTTSADTRDLLDADCEPASTTVADPPTSTPPTTETPTPTPTPTPGATDRAPATSLGPAPASLEASEAPVVTTPRRTPLARVTSTVSGGFVTGPRTRVHRLAVLRVARGTTVTVLCRGGGCPFARRSVRAGGARASLSLTALLRRAALRPGAVLEIRMTRPGSTGRVEILTIRARRLPTRRVLCLPPGATTPAPCGR